MLREENVALIKSFENLHDLHIFFARPFIFQICTTFNMFYFFCKMFFCWTFFRLRSFVSNLKRVIFFGRNKAAEKRLRENKISQEMLISIAYVVKYNVKASKLFVVW